MVEIGIEELKHFLITYALTRLKKTPFYIILIPMMPRKKSDEFNFPENITKRADKAEYYLELLIKNFIKLILTCSKEVSISQIISHIIAETNFVLKFPSWSPHITGANGYTRYVDAKFILESEIHNWFLFLEEKGKLPGKYERFLGIYTKKDI